MAEDAVEMGAFPQIPAYSEICVPLQTYLKIKRHLFYALMKFSVYQIIGLNHRDIGYFELIFYVFF